LKAVLQHKDTASASPKKALRGIAAGAVAVATAAALVFAGMPASFAANAVSIADSNYPAGTTAISDADTTDSYKQFPTGEQATSYDTTEFAGRLWTDKSVPWTILF